jgi:thioesterase domain-containing protein
VRGTAAPADTLADVVARARDRMWETLGHQGVPYPVVHRALPEPTRAALGEVPPVLLDFLGPIGTGLSLGSVPLRLLPSPTRTSRTDVGIAIAAVDGTYRAEVEYDTDRYDAPTVLALLQDLDAVLAADPSAPVGEIPTTTRVVPVAPDPVPVATVAGFGADALVDRLWAQVVGTPPAGPDEDFYAVGGRSLKAFDLVAAVEAETGARLDLLAFLSRPTPAGLAALLAGAAPAGPGGADSTLVTLRDGPGRHVHLLPGAGGTLADYRDLVDALPADWRVTGSRERTPLPDVPAAAARFHADLVAAGPPPDLLVGWSMGGQVGFALAGRYETDRPALAVLDAAPPIGYGPAATAAPALWASFEAIVRGGVDEPPDCGPVRSSPELALPALAACCRAAAADPDRAPSAAALAERWDAYRRHAAAVARYVAPGPLATPALLVAADLADADLDRWAALLPPAPRRLRLRTGHAELLHSAADEVAAALEDWSTALGRT